VDPLHHVLDRNVNLPRLVLPHFLRVHAGDELESTPLAHALDALHGGGPTLLRVLMVCVTIRGLQSLEEHRQFAHHLGLFTEYGNIYSILLYGRIYFISELHEEV